jgi:hypothetical protein
MKQVVQGKCPHCRQALRIPADWLDRPMRCKHCGQTFQARQKAPAAVPVVRPIDPSAAAAVPVVVPVPAADPFAFEPPAGGGGSSFAFARDEAAGPPTPGRARRRRRRTGLWVGAVIGVLLLGTAGVLLAVFGGDILGGLTHQGRAGKEKNAKADKTGTDVSDRDNNNPARKDGLKAADNGGVQRAGAAGEQEYFPRRALAIAVNHYLYANPVAYGGPGANTGAMLGALNRYLRFPNTQLMELSDGAPGARARPTLKPVIRQVVAAFLRTSRPMDRVVLFFSGHAVDLGKAVYLVPLEGILDDPKTLIPLTWVYDRLANCPARQRILILDVCRFDPGQGLERVAPGPMSPAMQAALAKPPPGVQVWSSCAAGQQSIDLFEGSLFQQALCDVLKNRAVKGIQEPTDPIAVEPLHRRVADYLAQHLRGEKFKQVPLLFGKDPNRGAPYDANEPLPPAVVVKPPPGVKGAAGRAAVQSILNEVGRLPPAKGNRGAGGGRLRVDVMPSFSAKVLAKYRPDYRSLQEVDDRLRDNPGKYKLIRTVRQAMQVLEHNAQGFRHDQHGRSVPVPPAEKNRIERYQMKSVAPVIEQLEEALKNLKKAGEERDGEPPPRWKAHYDYVLAKLTSRLIHVREYQLMLGKVRKDELPPSGPSGWQLASGPKLKSSDREVKGMLADRKEALKNLLKNHAGTPWEVLARRENATYLGLDWEPSAK